MDNGRIKLRGQRYFVGKAFCGEPVGVSQVGDSLFDVYYCHQDGVSLVRDGSGSMFLAVCSPGVCFVK
jgi:hypothetical protein